MYMLICPICNLSFKKIDSQHLRKHGLTKEEYKAKFPDGPLGASPETRLVLGNAVKSRGPRTQEQRDKISAGLKGKSKGRVAGTYITSEETKRKQSESRKKFYAEVGVSAEWAKNISNSLKRKYTLEPKSALDRNSVKYRNRLEVIQKAANAKKKVAAQRLEKELEQIKWGTFITSPAKDRVLVKCGACSTIIDRQVQTFRKHAFAQTICHTCFPPLNGTSRAEEEINSFLLQHDIRMSRHVRGILPRNLELDFYDADKKIAIEYHGLYWHSSAMDYSPEKHREKYEMCRDLGIHLIQIFEDEWVNKRHVVEDRLLTIFGKVQKFVGARECDVAKIPFSAASNFLEECHIQGGKVKTQFNFGLFYHGILVGVMTFQKPRIAMNQVVADGQFELVRFAVAKSIPGAFSKLLKFAIAEIKPQIITSWADLRWSNPHKNVYLSNGFSLKSESKVGYAYTDLVNRYHRFGCRKPAGEPLSEQEWNERRGFYRIFDAGTINYQLQIRN